MRKLILHIGYPKTATTALQKHVFAQLPSSSWELVTPENPANIIPNLELKKILQGDLPPLDSRISSSNKDWMISIEGVLFDCLRDLKEGREFKPRYWPDTLRALSAFAKVNNFQDVRIFVCLRRQDELVHSVYAQSYSYFFRPFAEVNTLEKYVDKIVGPEGLAGRYAHAYNFSAVVSSLIEEFGRSALTISFYEDVESDPAKEIEKMSSVVGFRFENKLQKANVRRVRDGTKLSTELTINDYLLVVKKRYLAWLDLSDPTKQLIKKIATLFVLKGQKELSLAEEDRKRLLHFFSPANRELSELLDVELPNGYCQE